MYAEARTGRLWVVTEEVDDPALVSGKWPRTSTLPEADSLLPCAEAPSEGSLREPLVHPPAPEVVA